MLHEARDCVPSSFSANAMRCSNVKAARSDVNAARSDVKAARLISSRTMEVSSTLNHFHSAFPSQAAFQIHALFNTAYRTVSLPIILSVY